MTRATSMTVLAAILAAGVAGGVGLQKALGARPGSWQDRPEPTAAAKQLQESFNRAAEYATKSVVHITTESATVSEDLPFRMQAPPQTSIGSGVIVSKDGYILTNHHVVEGARSHVVRFGDGREFKAEVWGTDPESDLALLKIGGADLGDLQPLEFADSDQVRPGDWVLAIGSPFGYNHSVSAGIVSAKHRVARLDQPYQDFIQTDAAINPGNSGGALVDLNGRLVGINAAIVSQSRTFEGIGLAISANLARFVSDRLLKDRRVKRGFVGVVPADLNEALVQELKQDGIRTLDDLLAELRMEAPRGVFVYHVEPRGPAEKAGLRFGDVLLELDGKRIAHRQALFFQIAAMDPGRAARARVLRNGRELELEIVLGERPPYTPASRRR